MRNSRARATIATLLILVTLVSCDGPPFWSKRKFDVQQWKATDVDERYVFADDLLGGKLIGLTKEEVKDQLGPPTSEASTILLYDIRESEPGEREYIYIKFGENKRASNTGIGTSD
jgi:hypothetical protein